MSEYQYYEFRAVDRPLDERELRKLRSLSARAEITPTSFVNTYNWGDFKGDPNALMETCFDVFVYVANWGTRRFVLRLPKLPLTRQLLSSYCGRESLQAREAGEFVVIDFCGQDDGGEEEEEGAGWMASLIPLRADLLRGDHRCLYLGWLCCAQNEEADEDEVEPPVPPGLNALSGSLDAFIDFMGIDSNLVDVAASKSGQLKAPPTRDELAAWIRAVPEKDKDALLVDAAFFAGSTGAEILRRYDLTQKSDSPIESQPTRRTVGELLAAASERAALKARLAAGRRAAERVRKEREAAAARTRYLDKLAGSEESTWRKIERLIQTKQPNKYDISVNLLLDLRDLAARCNRQADFQAAFGQAARLTRGEAQSPSAAPRRWLVVRKLPAWIPLFVSGAGAIHRGTWRLAAGTSLQSESRDRDGTQILSAALGLPQNAAHLRH